MPPFLKVNEIEIVSDSSMVIIFAKNLDPAIFSIFQFLNFWTLISLIWAIAMSVLVFFLATKIPSGRHFWRKKLVVDNGNFGLLFRIEEIVFRHKQVNTKRLGLIRSFIRKFLMCIYETSHAGKRLVFMLGKFLEMQIFWSHFFFKILKKLFVYRFRKNNKFAMAKSGNVFFCSFNAVFRRLPE